MMMKRGMIFNMPRSGGLKFCISFHDCLITVKTIRLSMPSNASSTVCEHANLTVSWVTPAMEEPLPSSASDMLLMAAHKLIGFPDHARPRNGKTRSMQDVLPRCSC
jgi:hypothetical protein